MATATKPRLDPITAYAVVDITEDIPRIAGIFLDEGDAWACLEGCWAFAEGSGDRRIWDIRQCRCVIGGGK